MPLTFDATTGQATLTLAPFVDVGAGWNHEDATGRSETLGSVGIGLLLTPASNFSARIYWGYALKDFGTTGDVQDMGFHFDVAVLRF